MYAAPALSYPVGRSVLYGGLVCLMLALGLLAQLVWWRASDTLTMRHGVVWVLSGVLWLWALHVWRHWPTAVLRWDGQHWTLLEDEQVQAVSVQVVLDGQSQLLLCLRTTPPSRRSYWVWPQARTQPERWLGLRQALFAKQQV